jgi:hypothetical protein
MEYDFLAEPSSHQGGMGQGPRGGQMPKKNIVAETAKNRTTADKSSDRIFFIL